MAKLIEITTTQNVTIEYETARLRERMLAWAIDVFLIVIVYSIAITAFLAVFGEAVSGEQGWFVVMALTPYLIYFLYNILFEILNAGQTLGKKAMSLKVVRLDGKEPEWSDVVLRALLQLIDTIFSAGIIGSLLIKTTNKSQRLGDMAAHTTVIRLYSSKFNFRLEDILKIFTLENYQPVFPQVRQLTEDDLLFIKNVLSRYQQYPNQAHLNVVEDLTTRLMGILKIEKRPSDRVEFLKTLLRDYIVLTR